MLSISLLLTSAYAACLDDAIPKSSRKTLVNENGETYPVGFFISNYAASYAANILVSTLVEEVMGFETTSNAGSPGSGTVAGYYGMAGCRTYNDEIDRGCMQGVTYFHVYMESWMGGYVEQWDSIQSSYSSMAPKDLGTMGYVGLSTIYVPKPIRNQAYSTSGRALQYYRDWNHSWNQPWNFFDSLASINTSFLAPCNTSSSVMMNDATMRVVVQWTGDMDGVVINDDVYSARCDDGFWWTPPSCRADPSQCVPFVTGGNGWGVIEFMQKFIIHNMPVAIGVAASWAAYTTIPVTYKVAIFWWSPDPTFVELAPLVVKFPPHNKQEFARGLRSSENSASVVSTVVSGDLVILAPIIETFADNIYLPMTEMDKILLDQKTTGDSWENVTCRWIKSNRPLWEKWLPDESNCFPGFGLYNNTANKYTNVRSAIESHRDEIVCQACPPGTWSQKLVDSKGTTHVCMPCAVGTSQDSGASLQCAPCKAGGYQDEIGSTECKRCPRGSYQDTVGQEACKVCPTPTDTLGVGSVAESDCGCRENFIDMDKTGAFHCVSCGEGLRCPALSQLADLELGNRSNGEQNPPRAQIAFGYYSTKTDPTEVYLCRVARHCPGGAAASCASGLTGRACSHCGKGQTWTGNVCDDCGGWRQVLWVLAILSILGGLLFAYYITAVKATKHTTVIFSTTASCGMLVLTMQNLGIIGGMTIEWPRSLEGLFNVCKFLLLDVDKFGFSCIAGNLARTRYLSLALAFPMCILWLSAAYGVSQLFPTYAWEGPRAFSTVGAMLQIAFGTMCSTALAPMMCYKHPNGLRSVMQYSGVICGTSDHQAMLSISWILLVVFVMGFVSLCTFAVVKMPRWSATQQRRLMLAFRFLIFRFRCDCWWFGPILLLRGPLIQLPVVFATDYPPVQIVAVTIVLTSCLVLQLVAWPWKVPALNLVDSIVSFCLVLVVTDVALYLEEVTGDMVIFASIATTCALSGIGLAIFVMFFMTFAALFTRSTAMGGNEDMRWFNLGGTPPPLVLAQKVKDLVDALEKINEDDLTSKIEALQISDLTKVTRSITLLAIEVAPPKEDKHSFKFIRRIASSSFDPALRRKSVSRSTEVSRASAASGRSPKRFSQEEMAAEVAARHGEEESMVSLKSLESEQKTEWI